MATQFGIGVYTAPEAARMIGMGAPTLRRWLTGSSNEAPLWRVQHEQIEDEHLLLGFRDLVEARIVNRLRQLGLSLQSIRTSLARARELVGDERPLSTRHFKTDGRTLFLQMMDGVDEPLLFDLRRRQGVFHRMVAPTLADIDYDDHAADRWWLLGGKRTVVADPTRSFGSPIVAEHGILTVRLAQAAKAEGSVEAAARLFAVRPSSVRDAVHYESSMGERLAA